MIVLGKRGVAVRHRQLLGFHKVKGEDSALNYCRDKFAAPVDKFVSVICEVRAGRFKPDAPRGMRTC